MTTNKKSHAQISAAEARGHLDNALEQMNEPDPWPAGVLGALADARRWIEEAIAEAVVAARYRDDPETWAQIAAALGISKQGAQQRYGNR